MPTQPTFTCATCDHQIAHHPVFHLGLAFCCAGCAADGPCMCSYDVEAEPVTETRAVARRGRARGSDDRSRAPSPPTSRQRSGRCRAPPFATLAGGVTDVEGRRSRRWWTWAVDAPGAAAPVAPASALAPTRGYPRVVMFGHDPLSQASASPSPLAGAALALIADGATPADLAERFAEAGATVEAIEVSVLLGELAGLGLVRIARHNGDLRFHVLTSLGRQVLGGSLGTDAGVVEHLAELERLRTDLLSTIAHELRTPLTAIRTCVGVLRDPATSPSPAEIDTLLDTIERNADRMQRVVGDILEIARFRTGQIFLQLRPFDASALAREAVASLTPLAAKRGQAIELDVPGAPVQVFGDHRRLEQALVNLISNAVKYGPEGGTIAVRVRQVARSVAWTVADQGPGIPFDEQPHLFERFFVGQNDRSGGGARGRAGPADGARDRPGARRGHRREERPGLRQRVQHLGARRGSAGRRVMRILVVDDAPDVVESVRLGFTLQWRDTEVLGAGTGEQALEVVEQARPDIVLLDVGLPGWTASGCSARFASSPMSQWSC